jgi:hypothetical protein
MRWVAVAWDMVSGWVQSARITSTDVSTPVVATAGAVSAGAGGTCGGNRSGQTDQAGHQAGRRERA